MDKKYFNTISPTISWVKSLFVNIFWFYFQPNTGSTNGNNKTSFIFEILFKYTYLQQFNIRSKKQLSFLRTDTWHNINRVSVQRKFHITRNLSFLMFSFQIILSTFGRKNSICVWKPPWPDQPCCQFTMPSFYWSGNSNSWQFPRKP